MREAALEQIPFGCSGSLLTETGSKLGNPPGLNPAARDAVSSNALTAAASKERTSQLEPDRKVEGKGKPVEYQPGLRIDFARKCVEVDCLVVLRQGPLELFACSVGTREHESILATRVRPLHLFQTLGLIGLEPGSPVRFDPQTEQIIPPRGARLRLDVRWNLEGETKVVPAGSLMLDLKTGRAPKELRWVFAGSHRYQGDRFGADGDGTIACVVDFANALVALDSSHSASNDELWLGADPNRVPPVGTACTLLIRSAVEECCVRLRADGGLTCTGAAVTPEALVQLVQEREAAGAEVRLVLLHARDAPAELLEKATIRLVEAGIEREKLLPQAEKPDSKPVQQAAPADPAPLPES